MIERIDPRPQAPELEVLGQFLDYQRSTLLRLVDGLTPAQWRTALAPSTLTLAGLVKHLALVEHGWFAEQMMGRPGHDLVDGLDWDADPDWEFRTALDDDPAELVGLYERSCAASRAIVAEVGDPDALGVGASRRDQTLGERFTLRWIILHMIEETARHVGHADYLRTSIDGLTDV